MLKNLQSSIEGLSWPAIPSPSGAAALSLLFQLENIQWWPAAAIVDQQFRQLAVVLEHAYATIPFYRSRFEAAGLKPAAVKSPEQLSRLPLLTRSELQEAGTKMLSGRVPKSHGGRTEISTSGSTGSPVKVFASDLASLFFRVIYLREHIWQKRDMSQKLVAIRFLKDNQAMPPNGITAAIWGTPENGVFATGPAAVLNIKSTISEQMEWLCSHNPGYLASYPSNILALAQKFMTEGKRLSNLRQVRTIGETLGPEVRRACRQAWDAEVVDMYSCNEVGGIALQCPGHEHYHIQAENILVEILDDQGRPCGPGETGRVVVTTLHNFTMPLIRYEIGDYAEMGHSCSCGRGLPVLARILGRQRNMLVFPNGEKKWPILPMSTLSGVHPVRQFQFVQKSPETIELKLVTDRALNEAEEREFTRIMHDRFNHPFRIIFSYPERIPRSKTGKYEDFISEIA